MKPWLKLKEFLGFGVEDIQTPEPTPEPTQEPTQEDVLLEKQEDVLLEKQEAFRAKFEQAKLDGVFCDLSLEEDPRIILDKFEEECIKKIEILKDYEKQQKSLE